LERRLGRFLTPQDFIDVPLNHELLFGVRMARVAGPVLRRPTTDELFALITGEPILDLLSKEVTKEIEETIDKEVLADLQAAAVDEKAIIEAWRKLDRPLRNKGLVTRLLQEHTGLPHSAFRRRPQEALPPRLWQHALDFSKKNKLNPEMINYRYLKQAFLERRER
jgi:hypothetical protein